MRIESNHEFAMNGAAESDVRMLRQKAAEFEGMLIAQVLQKLQECARLDKSEESDGTGESFQSLAVAAVGGGLARSGGLGLGEMLVRSLQSPNVAEPRESTP